MPPARFDHPGLARVAHYRTAHREDALAEVGRDALAGRFTFLSRTLEFGAEINWFRADLDVGTRLWKTLLHEFSYAPALATAHRRDPEAGYRQRLFALQRSWSSAAPIGCPGFARDAWNARAVATRLMHWSVAGSLLRLTSDDADGAALGEAVGRHGLFLRDNLELDLRGNHLFRDTVGLVFANEVVGGVPDALRWLESQVREQVLPDGAHMERSPMYHAICLEDLLEVRLLLGDAAPAWLDDALRRMAGLLESLLLGDGDIPLFGDAWLGEVTRARRLQGRAARRPARPRPHSGARPRRPARVRIVVGDRPRGLRHRHRALRPGPRARTAALHRGAQHRTDRRRRADRSLGQLSRGPTRARTGASDAGRRPMDLGLGILGCVCMAARTSSARPTAGRLGRRGAGARRNHRQGRP
ncbi:MAG: hypothetical protein JRG90_22525 [Deltaproteobacteria bacterium]|nr:hypothetical protein [Deltaproteobacteria bacterium]